MDNEARETPEEAEGYPEDSESIPESYPPDARTYVDYQEAGDSALVAMRRAYGSVTGRVEIHRAGEVVAQEAPFEAPTVATPWEAPPEAPTDILYDRQKTLDLSLPKAIGVIGVGGVGSWVALNLALSGVPKLTLVDGDIVERHNLNRTPFKTQHIGTFKVNAMFDLISERRPDCSISCYNVAVEDIPLKLNLDTIIDCRDMTTALPPEVKGSIPITGGYDGDNITIHVNPKPKSVWGASEPTTYSVVPSWLVPPQLIANIITGYLAKGTKGKKERHITLNYGDILKRLEVLP